MCTTNVEVVLAPQVVKGDRISTTTDEGATANTTAGAVVAEGNGLGLWPRVFDAARLMYITA